ncbi:MAG: short-chain dehydrogenase [Curvibacter sp. PD_MW3]|nr:MAG: short-chain dehydrogenase [Curvibacter sp. PD_MW3]
MPIPKPTTFLLGTPLYAKTAYEGDEVWAVLDVLYFNGTYDSYCAKCRRESTFQAKVVERPAAYQRNLAHERLDKQNGIDPKVPSLEPGLYVVHAHCTRTNSHKQDFVFFVDREVVPDHAPPKVLRTIQKVGQQPSYGDLHITQVKKYTHVLSNEQLSELTRAIGLASHDVGVGAYVYLRRIFETLVEEAHQSAVADPGWDEGAYQRLRMSERIAHLKSHLPNFLSEHPGMYSLLSKGIHELSEDECLKHFETLRIGIELILDERLDQRERAQKISAAKAAIQKALGDAGA